MNDGPQGRRKRQRRPPVAFDASVPTSSKKVKKEETLAKERGQSARNVAPRKPELPSALEYSASVKASQVPRAPLFLPFHPSIEMDTGEKVMDVPDWLAKHAASDAAVGKNYVGRMIGRFTVKVTCSKAVKKKLLASKNVSLRSMKKSSRSPFMKTWDKDGEFTTKQGEHVPVSRLVAAVASNEATCVTPPDGPSVLNHIFELQSPMSSPWKRPLLRALSTHEANPDGLTITYYVYTSCLLFELIADPAISGMMKGLEPIAKVTPPAKLEDQPVQFVSTRPSASATAIERDYEFSLAGILKSAESTGYRVVDDQPDDLRVKLFSYQRTTCQWMLDHERDPWGLNGYFWEKREWADGGDPLWYFPLAGEFRLAAPPHITGGLLCEEMGLGKTVEVLSTILSNPREKGIAKTSLAELRKSLRSGEACNYDSQGRVVSRATLLVVPVSLVGQWAQEIGKNVKPGTLRVMTFAGSVECNVPLSRVSVPGLESGARSKIGFGSLQRRSCFAPYLAPGEDAQHSEGWIRKGVVNLSAEQCRRLAAFQGSGEGDQGRGGGAGSGSDGMEEVEMVKVEFKADEWLLADNDVLLTTYEVLRSKQTLFRKLSFHRCVLDECQEIKTATTNIAKMCREVHATHRWMVSGTPLSSSIDDLHGELNFLQVWPFSLQNDGFWEKKIGEPFAAKNPDALKLLRALIGVVMMRHSKSQRQVDGRPLLKIPARTVEWRGVDFATAPQSGSNTNASTPHACYVYKYLEKLCASVCRRMQRNHMGRREFTKLKSLLTLMQKAATYPGLVNLAQLDTLKRSVDGQNLQAQQQEALERALKSQAEAIEVLPAEEVLRRLAQEGSGSMGGFNRDVNRHWAVGGEEEMKLRNHLEGLPLVGLQQRLEEEGLPVPRSWAVLKPTADIDTGSSTLDFGAGAGRRDREEVEEAEEGEGQDVEADAEGGGSSSTKGNEKRKAKGTRTGNFKGKGKGKEKLKDNGNGKGKGKEKRRVTAPLVRSVDMRKLLKVSDSVRVGVNQEDNEATVESVQEGSATLATKWVHEPVKGGRVYRFSVSSRRKPFVDILVTTSKTKRGAEVHAAGFSSIYKAMAGEPVPCPICMCSVVRPTVTKCAHLFCRECIATELQKVPVLGTVHSAKCPICRRPMKGTEMMELQPLSEVEEAVSLDDGNGAGASTAAATAAESISAAISASASAASGTPSSSTRGSTDVESNGLETAAGGDGSGGGDNAGRRGACGAKRQKQPGEVEVGSTASASSGHDGASASSSADADAGAGAGARREGCRNCPSQSARSGIGGGEGREMLEMRDDDEEEEEEAAGTNLVIPVFEMTPTATANQLNSILVPQRDIGERDPVLPSLETIFLCHYRAAISSRSSVKLDAMVTDIQETLRRDPSSKFVIFSQYPQVVERAGRVLVERGIRSTSIFGGRSRTERSSAVTSFANDPTIQAILITTGSGSAGLTLTAASTVYMLDPVWSAADEAQALNRAHRIGQTQAVRCVVFYMKDSVEERLLALRQAKGNFAQFLEDTGSTLSASSEAFGGGSFVNMFALPELKKLFGMVAVDDERSSVSSEPVLDSESDSFSESEGDVIDSSDGMDDTIGDIGDDSREGRFVESVMEDEGEGEDENGENSGGARGAMCPTWRTIFQTESARGGGASSPVDLT